MASNNHDDALSMNSGFGSVPRRVVIFCGAITAGTGVLVLAGWALGSAALTAMGTGYVAMAPNSALLFTVLGSALLVRELRPASLVIRRAAAAAALLSAGVAVATLLGFVVGQNIDAWLFSTTLMLGAVPLGRMSPITAFCFFVAGVALLLLERQAKACAALLGILIALAGAVCLMGYGFGAPVLHGRTVIPIALPTSLALVTLGVGLSAAAGPDTWPLNALLGPSTRARLLRALLPTVVALALINSWITASVLERSDPAIVLAAALTAISFLLVVSYAVTRVSGAIGDAIDQTDAARQRSEAARREQEQFFRLIAENIDDFIAIVDLEGRRLYNNPSYRRLFGATRNLHGTDSFAEIHPQDQQRVKEIFRQTVRSGIGHRIEFRFVLGNGDVRHMESQGAVIRDEQGRVARVLVVSRDITERKQMEDRVRELAFHDTLTKLPNRRLLSDRLTQIMAASKRSGRYGALMFIDLDNFKLLNDTHGHEVGDLLLIETADRLKNCVRETDTVARFGGDEFVVMISELDPDKSASTAQAGIIAEKIRATLAKPYRLEFQHEGKAQTTIGHHCTASIGVALFVKDEASQDAILKRADTAMYQAKKSGCNLARFYDSKLEQDQEHARPLE